MAILHTFFVYKYIFVDWENNKITFNMIVTEQGGGLLIAVLSLKWLAIESFVGPMPEASIQ